MSRSEIEHDLREARQRTLDLSHDWPDEVLLGPRLAIVNPLLWEIGHVAWFQEKWALRVLRGETSLRADSDALYDSAAVPHDTRWDLPLPTRQQTLQYMQDVLERAIDRLQAKPFDERTAYFYRLATFHEDMHGEAFAYTRQTLGLPPPVFASELPSQTQAHAASRFVDFPGGSFQLGARPGEPFVFDNEKWAHAVELVPYSLATTAVTNADFLRFVEDEGYSRREFWDDQAWQWRNSVDAQHPLYWRRAAGTWELRHYDRWLPLPPGLPILHVNAYEASAYCRWAGGRLPTEAEWEAAASGFEKRPFPWGDAPCSAALANLDGERGPLPVDAFPQGATPQGCLQLFGNTWEWTATPFAPYPGFVADPYKEYSAPWFDGRHQVLRGGCWVTRSRLLRATWRNFYTRDRRDVFAGFRVCRSL